VPEDEAPLIPYQGPQIHINGSYQASLNPEILRIEIKDELSEPVRCRVWFNHANDPSGDSLDYPLFDQNLFEFGKDLVVWQGEAPNHLHRLFDGVMTGFQAEYLESGTPRFMVEAADRLYFLKKRVRSRVFEDQQIQDIILSIAADHEINSDISVTDSISEQIAQVQVSDFDFIRKLVDRAGAFLKMNGNTLYVTKEDPFGMDALNLSYPDTLSDFQVLADIRWQSPSTVVSGWNPEEKEALVEGSNSQGFSTAPNALGLGGHRIRPNGDGLVG
jgi:hypothetical protein